MPLIDMKATDYTCIYSTMSFIQSQARKYSGDAIITFDQPLYWKAMEIKSHEGIDGKFKDIVLILGNFHTCMSFYGSIGHLMTGSGLQSVYELIYAEHTVPHMLNGKAYSRATRVHLITSGVLSSLMIMKSNGIVLDVDEHFMEIFHRTMNENNNLSTLSNMLEKALDDITTLDDVLLAQNVLEMPTKVKKIENEHTQNKTARLWLMYIEMVTIACKLVKAERLGSWMLHREATSEMLPYFAASGHYLYVKSAYLYLQSMNELNDTKPKVYELFLKGYHVVRRSDEYWAGLSTDLVIEQELLRSLKSTGGMTRGRGMDEL